MKIKDITVDGVVFHVEYEVHCEEHSTREYPGAPRSVEIFAIIFEGVDFYDFLSQEIINQIKDQL